MSAAPALRQNHRESIMLVLRSSPASPFGRKVKIAASVMGLRDRIDVVAADTTDPQDSLRQQNPLGKIPVLVFDNGDALYDSRVIVEYLDSISEAGRVIPGGAARFDALRLQALADGIADAALMRVYESRFRPEEHRSADWVAHHTGKVDRGLAHLEPGPLPEIPEVPHIGAIALACTLGYLDLRAPGWRPDYPSLSAWLGSFEERVPAFAETRAH
jgi:glutathione S-transferase